MRTTLFARAMFFAVVITGVSAFGADFRAGAGKSEIQTSPDMWPVEGYTSMHDQASVRVLILDDGSSRSAIVVIETPSISEGVISVAKAALTKVADVPAQNAIVFATHSTAAPHIWIGTPPGGGNARQAGTPQNGANAAPGGGPGGPNGGGPGGPGGMFSGPGAGLYAKAYQAAVEAAVNQAATSMQPAKLGFGLGVTDINVNRDLPTPKGWAQGSNPAGFSDKSLPVVRIENTNGKPLAVLMNVAVRSVVMDGAKDNGAGGKLLSADLSGAASRYVEQWYGGGLVAFFLMGAAVDQEPILKANRTVLKPDGSLGQVDLKETGFTLLDMLGERLGAEAIQASEAIKATERPQLQVLRRTLNVPSQGRSGGGPNSGPVQSFTYQPGPDIDFPLVMLRLGDIVVAGMQPELASSVGAQIKARSPIPNIMIATMADGGAKYLVDAQSYDRFTPEARGSQFARGAVDQVVKGVDGLLAQIKQSSAGK